MREKGCERYAHVTGYSSKITFGSSLFLLPIPCASIPKNAARHAGAIAVFVGCLKSEDASTEALEVASAAIRNLCGGSRENAEVCEGLDASSSGPVR